MRRIRRFIRYMGFVITDLRGINARWQRYNTKIVDKIILTTMSFYLNHA